MKRLICGAFAAALLGVCAQAAHVRFTLRDFMATATTNRVVNMLALSTPATNGSAVVINDVRSATTDTSGVCIFSNVMAGVYKVNVQGSPSTSFQLTVPSTNALVEGHDIVSSGVATAGISAWTTSQSDGRYISAPGGTNLVTWTNAGRIYVAGTVSTSASGTLTVSTNGTTAGTVATGNSLTIATNGTTAGTVSL